MSRYPASTSMCAIWFCCLGGLGIYFPYYSLYLNENAGLDAAEVGAVYAVMPLVGLFAQPFWGLVADRTGSRSRVLALLALGTALGYAALYLSTGFAALLLGTALLACFSTALIPACVSTTLALTRDADRHAFGLTRIWGTLGFLALVIVFPPLLHAWQTMRGITPVSGGPSEPGLEVMFLGAGLMLLIGGAVAQRLPEAGGLALRAARGDWLQLLRQGPFVRLLGLALLAYLFLQGPMGLFPLLVRAHGGSLDWVSWMWIPMLLAEIPVIALLGETVARIGARGLLAVGVIAGGLRWLVCGLSDDLAWILAAQLLHGVTVAGLLLGAPLYADLVVPEQLRSTGQAMLAMVGVSVGGIASYLGAGLLLDRLGADAPFLAGGVGALLLGAAVPLLVPRAARCPRSSALD
ncbi:MAG TPA: MFS transporter [Myxococcota bacterium]|nr:MFS transporter [Myxococcota bacterium]